MTEDAAIILSINDSPNKELTFLFHEADRLLEQYRKERYKAEMRYIRFSRIPYIRKILKNKIKPLRTKHEKQFKLTRKLYQNSDEFKATRGY